MRIQLHYTSKESAIEGLLSRGLAEPCATRTLLDKADFSVKRRPNQVVGSSVLLAHNRLVPLHPPRLISNTDQENRKDAEDCFPATHLDRTSRIDFNYPLKNFVMTVGPVQRLKPTHAQFLVLVFVFFVLIARFASANLMAGAAYSTEQPQGLAGAPDSSEISYTYKFENPRFYIPLIEIDLGSNGAGQVRFRRGESDEVLDLKVKLLPATISRIRELYKATGFLGSDGDYQDKKHAFPHMGWITLGARQGANDRKARFNYTINVEIKELEEIFRGIASQEIALLDLENAERYQPLDLPKQLETLGHDLELERIAEPEHLISALNEIAGDDTQALIARNQARKLVESIKKGKFKSPVKK